MLTGSNLPSGTLVVMEKDPQTRVTLLDMMIEAQRNTGYLVTVKRAIDEQR